MLISLGSVTRFYIRRRDDNRSLMQRVERNVGAVDSVSPAADGRFRQLLFEAGQPYRTFNQHISSAIGVIAHQYTRYAGSDDPARMLKRGIAEGGGVYLAIAEEGEGTHEGAHEVELVPQGSHKVRRGLQVEVGLDWTWTGF